MANSLKPFIIPIFIPHSGCPHQCIFCNQKAISGTIHPLPTGGEIHGLIDNFIKYRRNNRSCTEVSFFGGNFLGLTPTQIRQLLDSVMSYPDSEKIDGIRFSSRPDTIDSDRLALIREYPVSTVELGVQSMDDTVLARAGRGHCANDTINAVRLLKQETCQVGLQMMTGLPGDTEGLCLASARKIIDLAPDFVRIYPTLVIKGSPLADLYLAGKYTPLSLDACVSQVKELYLLFDENGIDVIRMGLQASKELNDPKTVLAGPYHPALGHLVFSKIFLDRAVEILRSRPSDRETRCITVNPRSLSRMQGLNKTNILELKQMFFLRHVTIKTDAALARDVILVD